jgi:hypothetical protein
MATGLLVLRICEHATSAAAQTKSVCLSPCSKLALSLRDDRRRAERTDLRGGEEVPADVEDAHVLGSAEGGEGAPRQVEAVVVHACMSPGKGVSFVISVSVRSRTSAKRAGRTRRARIGDESLDAVSRV